MVEKPNLVLVSKYSTFFRNKRGKIKGIFLGKVIHFNTWETFGYITSKHENVGNVLQFLLRFHPGHSDLKMTKFEFKIGTKSM